MKAKSKKKKTKNNRELTIMLKRESILDKWIYYKFKLDFFKYICKTTLFFKLNLEIALSIVLKETGWSRSTDGTWTESEFINISNKLCC